ncbi:MAG: PqqD family protein [Bacteroidales bacterium]|nr:PqqD family protein [Bacteroidales bacterium]
MKIIDGFVLRPLGEEFIVIGEGISQINFNKMISLNSTAAFLWENVEGKDFTVEDLTKLLTDNYEVEEERASADAAAIAAKWIEAGIVSE